MSCKKKVKAGSLTCCYIMSRYISSRNSRQKKSWRLYRSSLNSMGNVAHTLPGIPLRTPLRNLVPHRGTPACPLPALLQDPAPANSAQNGSRTCISFSLEKTISERRARSPDQSSQYRKKKTTAARSRIFAPRLSVDRCHLFQRKRIDVDL